MSGEGITCETVGSVLQQSLLPSLSSLLFFCFWNYCVYLHKKASSFRKRRTNVHQNRPKVKLVELACVFQINTKQQERSTCLTNGLFESSRTEQDLCDSLVAILSVMNKIKFSSGPLLTDHWLKKLDQQDFKSFEQKPKSVLNY